MMSYAVGKCRKLGAQNSGKAAKYGATLWLPTCKPGVQCQLAIQFADTDPPNSLGIVDEPDTGMMNAISD
jgi:hypothetical protein